MLLARGTPDAPQRNSDKGPHQEIGELVPSMTGVTVEGILTDLSAPRSVKKQVSFSIAKDGDTIEVGDFHFWCISTPGRSPRHMSLYEPNRKVLCFSRQKKSKRWAPGRRKLQ
jgi:flavorubredoxin